MLPAGNTGLLLGQMYLPGVHPSGPYFLMERTPNTLERVPLAISEFKKKHHVTTIDAIVVSANLWDLARLCKVESQGSCQGSFLNLSFINGWMSNFTALINKIKSSALPSEPIIVFHTTAMPHADPGVNPSLPPMKITLTP